MACSWDAVLFECKIGCEMCLTQDVREFMQGLSYWVRNPTAGPLNTGDGCDLTSQPASPDAARQLSQTRPIVFLHGVGFGLVSHA